MVVCSRLTWISPKTHQTLTLETILHSQGGWWLSLLPLGVGVVGLCGDTLYLGECHACVRWDNVSLVCKHKALISNPDERMTSLWSTTLPWSHASLCTLMVYVMVVLLSGCNIQVTSCIYQLKHLLRKAVKFEQPLPCTCPLSPTCSTHHYSNVHDAYFKTNVFLCSTTYVISYYDMLWSTITCLLVFKCKVLKLRSTPIGPIISNTSWTPINTRKRPTPTKSSVLSWLQVVSEASELVFPFN